MPSENIMRKILIANRAEIACRVIDSVQAAGFDAIAVHSDADAQSRFVSMADASVAIGGQTPAESYLDIDKIINAAKAADADAIHPGYGFLSENADFARACADNNIKFIGPSSDAINLMGNKASAKDDQSRRTLRPGLSGNSTGQCAFDQGGKKDRCTHHGESRGWRRW